MTLGCGMILLPKVLLLATDYCLLTTQRGVAVADHFLRNERGRADAGAERLVRGGEAAAARGGVALRLRRGDAAPVAAQRVEHQPGQAHLHHAHARRPHARADGAARSEEHTSELQSRVDISYAVFCLKKKTQR